MPRWSPDDPLIKKTFKKHMLFHKKLCKSYCFVINDHFEHKSTYKTYLKLKISIGAFDCLNITSVSLLGCSFVPKQGP